MGRQHQVYQAPSDGADEQYHPKLSVQAGEEARQIGEEPGSEVSFQPGPHC